MGRIFIWLAAACLCLGPAAAEAECKISVRAEMPLRMEGNTPLLVGQINGRDVQLIADMGASKSVIFGSALKRLGLSAYVVDNTTFYGIDGSSRAYSTTLPTIKLGTMSAKDLSVFVIGKMEGDSGPVVGLIGADFFGQSDLEFDFAHGVIRFLKADGCKEDEVLYWGGAYSMLPLLPSRDDNEVSVSVKLNGQPVDAMLDTGASVTLVNIATARRVGAEIIPDPTGKYLVTGTAGQPLKADTARFASLVMDQEALKNVTLTTADVGSRNITYELGSRLGSRLDSAEGMMIGADFFRSHRIYVSRSQRRIYFTYNGGPVFTTEAPKAKPPTTPSPPVAPKG